MDKKKLWVYGCSFSLRFYPTIVNISWPEIIADNFGLELINRSTGGWGWNLIKDSIDKDFINWSKNDIIIISPSYFARINIVEMKNPFPMRSGSLWLSDMKDYAELYKISEERWKNTILNLLHCEYNVWTWPWNQTEYVNIIPTIIPNPKTNEKEKCWHDWNQNTKQYWCRPNRYDRGDGIWIERDTHFNNEGHKFIGEHMLKYINKKS